MARRIEPPALAFAELRETAGVGSTLYGSALHARKK